MKRFWYYAVQVAEYILAALFLEGGIKVFISVTIPEETGIVGALIQRDVVYLYAASWILLGLGLLLSKWFKMRRLHGWMLMGMYLTIVYVCVLDLIVIGIHPYSFFNWFIGIVTAALYLRWKYVVSDLEG